MILAPERWYADSHSCAKATHPEAYGIDCGASRSLKRASSHSAARALRAACGDPFQALLVAGGTLVA